MKKQIEGLEEMESTTTNSLTDDRITLSMKELDKHHGSEPNATVP